MIRTKSILVYRNYKFGIRGNTLPLVLSRFLSADASNLRLMIFGSGTGVGKTIVSAGICRAALEKDNIKSLKEE